MSFIAPFQIIYLMIQQYKPSIFALQLSQFQSWLFFETIGPKILVVRYHVNFFKGLTFMWILTLMWIFKNNSIGMWLYLLIHGSYGFCWVTKDRLFPDSNTLKVASLGSHIILFFLLVSYWMIPVPLAMGYGVSNPSLLRIISILCIYIFGIILMMGADYQKHQTLKRRKGLISDGFFKYTRNPNYLGQVLIYISFCICSGNFMSFVFFFLPATPLFMMNIYLKEEISYKAKPGYQEYKMRSNILLLRVFANQWLDWLFYILLIAGLIMFYRMESPQTFFYPFDQRFKA